MPNETTAVKNCDDLRNAEREKTARQTKRKMGGGEKNNQKKEKNKRLEI